MTENYETVPNIITEKDLDYLSDMFEWNYGGFKKTTDACSKIQDSEIKNMMEKASNIFYSNMNTILNILDQGGQNE